MFGNWFMNAVYITFIKVLLKCVYKKYTICLILLEVRNRILFYIFILMVHKQVCKHYMVTNTVWYILRQAYIPQTVYTVYAITEYNTTFSNFNTARKLKKKVFYEVISSLIMLIK